MTGQELDAALAELGLRHDAPVTRALLGVTGRSIRYYLAGHKPVPRPLAHLVMLLVLLARSGIPPSQVSTLVGSKVLPLGRPAPLTLGNEAPIDS
jgi:hypothetical protein